MPPIRRLHVPLSIAGLAVSAVVHAAPVNEITWEYYADKDHTVLVGERILGCGGGVRKWGKTTGTNYIKTQDSCAKRIRSADTPLAHMLMHHDPYLACTRHCDSKFPLQVCGQNEDCDAEKRECLQACQQLLQPEPDPAAERAPAPETAASPAANGQ